MRVSLARTGIWIRGLGLRQSLDHAPFSEGEIEALSRTMETRWGPVRHLRPAVSLSAADVGWELPPVPLGTHPPELH